jgi:hypothetical protein
MSDAIERPAERRTQSWRELAAVRRNIEKIIEQRTTRHPPAIPREEPDEPKRVKQEKHK